MTCNDKEDRLHTEVRIAEKYFKIFFFCILYVHRNLNSM